jgi:hypothetical protein
MAEMSLVRNYRHFIAFSRLRLLQIKQVNSNGYGI